MSGDLIDEKYDDKILLIVEDSLKGYVEGIKWKNNLSLRSSYVKKYGFNELIGKLKLYVEKNGSLPKEGILFSEKAKRFLY
jgi:hypothetical protein